MSPLKWLLSLMVVLALALDANAQTFINTVGSDDNTAISGFDTVAFFVDKKAMPGKLELRHEYLGATWLFASQEHLDQFKAEPEKYLPEWGGQCAWGIAEGGYVSKKKLSGEFAVIDSKLYLFSFGNESKKGPWQDFLYGRVSQPMRIREGNRLWPETKRKLEAGELEQAKASNYKRTRFD